MAYGMKVTPHRRGPAPRRFQRLGSRRVQGMRPPMQSIDELDSAIMRGTSPQHRALRPRMPKWDEPMGRIVKSV